MAFSSSPPTPIIRKIFIILVVGAIGLVYFAKIRPKVNNALDNVDADPNGYKQLVRRHQVAVLPPVHHIIAQLPRIQSTPKAQPTPCDWCRIRAERYNHAVQTGFAQERTNVRMLQQAVPTSLAAYQR